MKLRKYGKKRPIFTSASISPKNTIEAAYNFITTHELVEMTISILPVFDIAQMQRVCKSFRDLIKTSSKIRRAVRGQSWLPSIKCEDPSDYRSALPFNGRLDFDSGLRFRPDVRFFRVKSVSYRPTFSNGPDVVEIEVQHTIEHDDDLPRPEISGKHKVNSAKLWRMLPLCQDGIVVDVIFKSKYKGWRTVKKFGPESALAEVYEWLVDVRDRRLQTVTRGAGHRESVL